jgi:hypothetical protein
MMKTITFMHILLMSNFIYAMDEQQPNAPNAETNTIGQKRPRDTQEESNQQDAAEPAKKIIRTEERGKLHENYIKGGKLLQRK